MPFASDGKSWTSTVGLALRLRLLACVLEVADLLLLRRVDGDHRHVAFDAVLRLGVDVLELRIAIGMLRAFDGLSCRLKAVAVLVEQLGHGLVADSNLPLREQLGR